MDILRKKMVFAFYILLVVILVIPSLAVYPNLQRQLVRKSDQGELIQSRYTKKIGEAAVLNNVPDYNSANPLRECHLNDVDAENVYTFYFTDVCPKEKYFCINGNGYTLHICAEIPKCEKRFRNVVVYNSEHPNTAQIFSVPCPDGYLQFSYVDCFRTCIEDQAIVVVRGTTPDHHALAFCNTEADKCNPHGKKVFYLASEDDFCTTADRLCDDTEDFLPDCSCSPRCLPGQVRTADSNFICKPDAKPPTIQPISIRPTTLVTSQSTPSLSESKNLSNNQDNTSNYTLVGIIVGVVLFIALIGGAILVYRFCILGGYQRAPTENRETELSEIQVGQNLPTSNGVNSAHKQACSEENGDAGHRQTRSKTDGDDAGKVTIKKKKRVDGDEMNCRAGRDINIHINRGFPLDKILPNEENSDRSHSDTDVEDVSIAPQESVNRAGSDWLGHTMHGDEQQMNNLKENSFQDIGFVTDDQTHRKQIV